MARCLNCIHCDVCDSDRHDKERLYGDCSDFLHDDVVEVVRCKDCSYCVHGHPVKAIGEEALEGWYCRQRKRYMRSDDFCSYGERKEER